MHYHLVVTKMSAEPNRAQVLLLAVTKKRGECVARAMDLKRERRYRAPWQYGVVDCPRPLADCQQRIVGQSED